MDVRGISGLNGLTMGRQAGLGTLVTGRTEMRTGTAAIGFSLGKSNRVSIINDAMFELIETQLAEKSEKIVLLRRFL